MLPYPKAILLDWDSTLVDGWDGIAASWNYALGRLGRPASMTRDRAVRLSGLPHSELFAHVFGASEAEQGASLLYRHRAEIGMAGLAILPGSQALLDGLQALAIPLAVISNKRGPVLRQEIGHLGWAPYFATAVGAGDAAEDKPHPAPLLLALDRMGPAPGADIWMVGDMHSDMQAARRAGVGAVLMETTAALGIGLEGDMTAYPPHLRATDAAAVLELVLAAPKSLGAKSRVGR